MRAGDIALLLNVIGNAQILGQLLATAFLQPRLKGEGRWLGANAIFPRNL
jgi:hypothetical protein